jgi:hypothetical protein
MSSGGWTTTQGTEVGGGGDYRQRPAYALRPLSLGEILDRSFAVYRANFWLFVGIGSLSAIVQLIVNVTQLLLFHGLFPNPHQAQAQLRHETVLRQISSSAGALPVLLVSAVVQAATVWALSEVYLGRRTSIGEAIRAVAGRCLRFLGIALWQIWSGLWLMLLVAGPGALLIFGPARIRSPWIGGTLIFLGIAGGAVYGVIAFIRNSLGVQSAVLEQLKVRAAMRRSKVLTAGAKGRIFVVFLIGWCLFLVVGMIEMPLSLLILLGTRHGQQHIGAQVGLLVVNFLAYSVVVPVIMIGLSLVYFDQRVRQDGLDLLLMLDGGANSGTGGAGTGGAGAGGGAPPTLQTGEPASDAAAL